ncbi:MAG: dihydroorotase family protein [Candidatus Muirbacterium halophilum]|nr:dihydroorotase family protein [Candidatus Muirbacterium halophilum]MCK9475669.1 dihydroorotase family protein [Candidatus Muirbacterium halophilum]
MSENLLIKNGFIDFESNIIQTDILISSGKIEKIAPNIVDINAKIIDATDKYLLPGVIDSHVFFNDPGYTHREDFTTGSKAAIKGGVTTVVDMGSANVPYIKNIDLLNAKFDIIKNKSYCDYVLAALVTADEVDKRQFKDISLLMDSGACGIELYTSTTVSGIKHLDNGHLYELFNQFKNSGYIFIIHSEDFFICDYNIRKFKMKNKNFPKAWSEARPEIAEEIAVSTIMRLAKEFDIRIHFNDISCEKSVKIISEAKKNNVDVTCSTALHYLEFCDEDCDRLGNLSKLIPPLRKKHNNIFLWQSIVKGDIDIVSSSHNPFEYRTEKQFEGSNIWNIYAGTPELEHTLLYLFSEGFLKHRISLNNLNRVLSENPAKRFGISPKKGLLRKGSDADIIILNPKKKHVVEKSKLTSKAGFSIFEGMTFNCAIENTILNGKIVYDINKGILGEISGNYIKRQYI